MHFAVPETQAHAVALQQHQLAIHAGKRGERRVGIDLGDGQAPVPFRLAVGSGFRVHLSRPARAVAPALAPIVLPPQAAHVIANAGVRPVHAASVSAAWTGPAPDHFFFAAFGAEAGLPGPNSSRSRFFSTVFRPMPLTWANCSGVLNAPCCSR